MHVYSKHENRQLGFYEWFASILIKNVQIY